MLTKKFAKVVVCGGIGAVLGMVWSLISKNPNVLLWTLSGLILGNYQGLRLLGFSWKSEKLYHRILIIVTIFTICIGGVSFQLFGEKAFALIFIAYSIFQILLIIKLVKSL